MILRFIDRSPQESYTSLHHHPTINTPWKEAKASKKNKAWQPVTSHQSPVATALLTPAPYIITPQ